jgi:hypothetical protein
MHNKEGNFFFYSVSNISIGLGLGVSFLVSLLESIMYEYRNKYGVKYSTLTVSELIEALSKLPGDLPVLATWDDLLIDMHHDTPAIMDDVLLGFPPEAVKCVVLNVNNY